jgi:branched-chain amino acid transport system permease protein
LLLGATYVLVALGFNLVVGAMDRLNFALGETAMASAVVAAVLLENTRLWFPIVFLIAAATGALLSVLVYLISFRFVNQNFPTASVLSTLGMGILLTAVVTKIWGTSQHALPGVLGEYRWNVGFATITGTQVMIIGLSLIMTVSLYVFLERTVWGTAIRGVSDDAVMTGLLGVPVRRVIVMTFAISGLLAGSAGLLTGVAYHTVSPYQGFTTTLTALIVIVIGGLGSVTGGVIAALLIAEIETLSAVYLSATMRDLVTYILVGVVLIARPYGIMGRNAGVLERV